MGRVNTAIRLGQHGGVKPLLDETAKYIHEEIVKKVIRLLSRLDDPRPLYRKYVAFRRRLQPQKFTDADPFKIIWVDPSEIEYGEKTTTGYGWGRVEDGNWDRSTELIEGLEGITAHFKHGVPWTETQRFQKKVNRIRRGKTSKGCASAEELEARYKEIDKLYETIRKNGYQPQRTIIKENPLKHSHLFYKSGEILHPELDEVKVTIGRDGQILHRHDGRHRLAIAKLLDIESIPVVVRTRHLHWQEVRDDYVNKMKGKRDNSDRFSLYKCHPDLYDITQGSTEK
ncbi:ParB N-terminal domain-containing protein [Natronorarus salvus]|uniref:hypothetical protein n=1 Tax=Natronorarus salvus TaxID=3117733 RepID=UPI002F26BA4B